MTQRLDKCYDANNYQYIQFIVLLLILVAFRIF